MRKNSNTREARKINGFGAIDKILQGRYNIIDKIKRRKRMEQNKREGRMEEEKRFEFVEGLIEEIRRKEDKFCGERMAFGYCKRCQKQWKQEEVDDHCALPDFERR